MITLFLMDKFGILVSLLSSHQQHEFLRMIGDRSVSKEIQEVADGAARCFIHLGIFALRTGERHKLFVLDVEKF